MNESADNMRSRPVFSVGILAGGKSSRMGKNKALVALGGKPVISYVIDALRPLADDVFIVANDCAAYERFGLPVHPDRYGFRASLVGIYSALASSGSGCCLVGACDMPFVEPSLAGLLADLSPGFDAVIPVSDRGMEPLFALYSKDCLEPIRGLIEHGDLAIHQALDALKVRYVEAEELSSCCDPSSAFMNINSESDMERAAALVPENGEETGPARRRGPERHIVCFVGKKNSGKTTFLEKLVSELTSRGLKIAYIKHDVHGFRMDHEGTDTWRIANAGARSVIISSPTRLASLERTAHDTTLEELMERVDDSTDLIIAEGYKGTALVDKLEVSRSGRSDSLACPEEDLLAVVSDRPDAATRVPVFGLEDFAGVADLLSARYGFKAKGKAVSDGA